MELRDGPLGVVGGQKQFGNAEIKQLRLARGCNNDVGRFDVAVNYQLLMGVRNCAADFGEKFEPIVDIKTALVAELSDRFAFDMLHYEVGQPVRSRTAAVQARNVRMFQPGENLPFQ